jgi:Flp pilus assembly protein TadD
VLNFRTKAVALSPDGAELHLDLAIALCRLGRRDEACRHLTRAREIFPGIDQLRWEDVEALMCDLQGAAV